MIRKNKLLYTSSIIGSLFLITSCSGGSGDGTGESADESSDCTIGFSIINQQDIFFTQMVDGAKEKADDLGCELKVANADNDPTAQSSDIERLVTQQVDGLIVNPIDVDGSLPAIDDARDFNVPIVSIDTNIGEEHYDSFVGVDNGEAAKEFAEYMLEKGFGDGTAYGTIEARISEIQNRRVDEFRSVVDEAGANFVQAVDGENQNEQAATAATDLLTAQSELDYIYTSGTPATLGAVSALEDMDDPDTKVIGWDLTEEIIQGIDDGLVEAIVQQNAHKEGESAVEELHSILNGEDPQGEILIPIDIVTQENVDDFRSIYE